MYWTPSSTPLALALLLALLVWLPGCGETPFGHDDDDDASDDDDDAGDDDGGDDDAGDDDAADDDGGDDDSGDDDTEVPEWVQICERWNDDRASLSEGSWSGDVGQCDAGDISAEGRDNALRVLNLYRWLADLPPVQTDASRDAMTQECALLMHAHGSLSHYPDASWDCYTTDGAGAAGNSNISSGPGVMSVDMYMDDHGNESTMGHRRWILSNGLGPVGLGSTSTYSCMWVLGGSGSGNNTWTAWPPPGPFPLQAIAPSWYSIDDTGWSIQSGSVNLLGAGVTVTVNGQDRPVDVWDLSGPYGNTSGIAFTPDGWSSQAGETYEVQVSSNPPISYEVEVVDCSGI